MENIGTIINLSLVLTRVNENSYYKGIIFISAITIIYALNFGWICLYVLFIKKGLESAGSTYFLSHAFYDFAVFFGYFVVILLYGAEANNIDFKIKDLLIKLQVDCNEAVILAHQQLVYEKDGHIHIMKKQSNGTYYSLRDEKYYKTLDGFTPKNDEVMDKTALLNKQITLGIKRIDYKLDN